MYNSAVIVAEKEKDIVKVSIEVVLIVLLKNYLQFDNLIKQHIRLLLYIKQLWVVGEEVRLIKVKIKEAKTW